MTRNLISKALFTGSRVYGKPTPDSDIDIVIEVTKEELDLLHNANHDSVFCLEKDMAYSFKFGKLNLIAEISGDRFNNWVNATAKCIDKKPLGKEEYLPIFNFFGFDILKSSDGKKENKVDVKESTEIEDQNDIF